jgi:hypothetical protein
MSVFYNPGNNQPRDYEYVFNHIKENVDMETSEVGLVGRAYLLIASYQLPPMPMNQIIERIQKIKKEYEEEKLAECSFIERTQTQEDHEITANSPEKPHEE